MKPLVFLLAVLVFVARPFPTCAQSTGIAQTPSRPSASIERHSNQLYLLLTNSSETSTFQGVAKIALEGSADLPLHLSFKLAPEETRRLSLPGSMPLNGQFVLSISDLAGSVVLYKIAKPVAGESFSQKEFTKPPAEVVANSQIKVYVKLPRSSANREAEVALPSESEPILLAFVVEPVTPVKDAWFTLSNKDFERRQRVTMQGRAEIEFTLPEALSDRRLHYTVMAENGDALARGKVDLDQLAASDSILVSALTFDKTNYTAGESARVTIELLGEAPHGFRLELTLQEGGETSLFKDERKGVNVAGKSRHEFLFDLPREVKGPIILTYKVFGGQTGLLFDSGVRVIPVTEAPPTKTAEGKRLAP